MAWQQVFQSSITYSNVPVVINYEFKTTQLIIKATSARAYSPQQQVGWFYGLITVPVAGQTKTRFFSVFMGTQLLDIPWIVGLNYKGEFVLMDWIGNINLIFYEDPVNKKDVRQIT
jgi:hypothetical protein